MVRAHSQMQGVADIVRASPICRRRWPRAPQHIQINLETVELNGQLNEGTSCHYWTFSGRVLGPFVRVRDPAPSAEAAPASL